MNQDVLSLIESKRSAMSKGQRRIADYIETEYDKSFKDQLKCALETAPRYLNSKYISRFTAIAKLLGDNDDRLKALIKDGAALYEVNKDLRPIPILRLKHIHHNDKERFSRLFDEALSDTTRVISTP